MRADWNARLVLSALVDTLDGTSEWWEDVAAVRAGDRALDRAGGYAKGRRREPIAVLLELAAGEGEDDRSSSVYAMYNAGLRAHTVDPEHPAVRSGRFHEVVADGVEAIGRRRQRRCLSCGLPLNQFNRGLYCGPHEAPQFDRGESVRAVFAWLKRLGPCLPTDRRLRADPSA